MHFDSNGMRLYPRIPDPESVKKHFQMMADGKLTPHYGHGRRLGGSRDSYASRQPKVQLVTPTAMAEEQARARLGQVKRRTKTSRPIKRRKTSRPIKKRKTTKKRVGKGRPKTIKRKQKKKKSHSRSRRRRDNFS